MTNPAPRTLRFENGVLYLLNQTKLPLKETVLACRDVRQVHDAISRLVVRGAPAIGCAAAYGVCVAAYEAKRSGHDVPETAREAAAYLATSRPTAVNLFWALDEMRRVIDASPDDLIGCLEKAARKIEQDDIAMCRAIGENGAPLLPQAGGVMTHCNAGSLATAGDGTALSVLFAAHAAGNRFTVFANETRPLLQGARLTSWECLRRGLDVKILCDGAAGWAMASGLIHAVVTGADRIAANGDAANKIGTYGVAALARQHEIPFYIAAPSTTFDLSLASGDQIEIEQRSAAEITEGFGTRTAPEGVAVWNPAFDVTPRELITAIITEHGVLETPDTESVANHLHPGVAASS